MNGIYLGSLDSKESKRLSNVNSQAQYVSPGYLLFVRGGTLVAQPFDAGRLELSGEPFPVAPQVAYDSTSGLSVFSTSDNGVLAYKSALADNTELVWFDRMGKRLGTVGPPGQYLNPELSPDGRRLAVERFDGQGSRDVWLAELSRNLVTRFTFDPAQEEFPIWSPDGNRIVFASNRNRPFNLYQKLSSGAANEEILYRWRGDGKELYYIDPNRKLMAVAIKGDSTLEIGAPKALLRYPTIKPARRFSGRESSLT